MIQISLDMDMPEECHECPFQLKFKDGEADEWHMRRCVIMQRKIEYPRPEWCPLESVPDGETVKEQVPIKPAINEYGEAFCICGENVGIIPDNKNHLPSIRSEYCPRCGRRMKWE